MPTIEVLGEDVANHIAAGEVVERPASVVKELVENSLDAGAQHVRVTLEEGGKRSIIVRDDGSGMDKEDLLLCLERHATSKLRCPEDLSGIYSFGFRGEALPAVSSVSRLVLQSRTADAEGGWQVRLEGGRLQQREPCGMPAGTIVQVRDLFFNTPARQRFLRRKETECKRVAEVMSRLALAWPQVAFTLAQQHRVLLQTAVGEDLPTRVGKLLGRNWLQGMLEVTAEDDPWRLWGLVSEPDNHRAAGGSFYLYINQRPVRDRLLQSAVMEAYRHLLPKGRYPVVVLFLEVPPQTVDVNVHPTKQEVRFQQQGQLKQFVTDSLRRVLAPAPWLSPDTESATSQAAAEPRNPIGSSPESAGAAKSPAVLAKDGTETTCRQQQASESVADYRDAKGSITATQPQNSTASDEQPAQEPRPANASRSPAQELPWSEAFFSRLQILGQYAHSYILCQDGQDLVLIDQHAAHERIGFVALKEQFFAEGIVQQRLLYPTQVECSWQQQEFLERVQPQLARLGLEVEPFGGRSWVIKSVPQLLAREDAKGLLWDVLAALGAQEHDALEEALDEVLLRMACHHVVRAQQALTVTEMQALLQQLDRVSDRGHCPHGRPVMARLPRQYVEGLFARR